MKKLFRYSKLAASAPSRWALAKAICGLVLIALTLSVAHEAFADSLSDMRMLAKARPNLPILKEEIFIYWPKMPMPATIAAQVEQESYWNPRAELRTSRERGVGLGQITKTARFDALAEIRASNPTALAGWSWQSNLYDPRMQLRALVLKDLQGYKAMQGAATEADRLAFAYAAYNGGIGGVLSDRRVCRGTRGCVDGRWFGNVERTSLKQKKPVAGYGQSFFEINREYVRNVLIVRRPKYDREFA